MPIHPEAAAFLLGCAGSIALELVFVCRAFERGRLPRRYQSFGFWLIRVALSLLAGIVAWAYYNPALHQILYVHIGAATPVLLVQFANVAPDADEPTET
jgi:hypothetical protein